LTVKALSKIERRLTVTGVLFSMSMAAMEATIVSTAMPTVVEQLGGIEYYGWVGAVYLLTSTVSMPLYGKLSDIYGRKPILMLSMVAFLVGSMASGFAQSMTQLIVFRAVQGTGAGGMQPVSLTIIGDVFKPAERARMQGVFGAIWAVAAMSGPLLGGLIVHALSWRWVFFINLPFGLVSMLLISAFFHEHKTAHRHTLDVAGAAALAGAVVALLLGTSRFAAQRMLPLAVLLLGAFVAIESRAREPVLSLALLRRPIMRVSSVAGAAIGAVLSATVIYLPLYVQAILEGTPTQAGATVSPMLLGWPIASAIGGRYITRIGYGPLVRGGFLVVALASTALALLLRSGASATVLGTTMFIMGCGMGVANSALLIAVQASCTWQERGVATASALFFRTIGGAIAVGALGALLAAGMGPSIPASLLNRLLAPDHGSALDPALTARLFAALRAGLHHVFDVIGLVSLAALAAALFFPAHTHAPEEPTAAA